MPFLPNHGCLTTVRHPGWEGGYYNADSKIPNLVRCITPNRGRKRDASPSNRERDNLMTYVAWKTPDPGCSTENSHCEPLDANGAAIKGLAKSATPVYMINMTLTSLTRLGTMRRCRDHACRCVGKRSRGVGLGRSCIVPSL
jgi:hypothetical protein